MWWLVSETRMHRLPKKLFLLRLRQDNFSNETIKIFDPTPPLLYLKECDIFNQIQQGRHSQAPLVARFRDTYEPTSRKYVSTERKTRSVQ